MNIYEHNKLLRPNKIIETTQTFKYAPCNASKTTKYKRKIFSIVYVPILRTES